MRAEAKSLSLLNRKVLSSFDEAKSFVSSKLATARSSALTRVVDAGERLTERQIALLSKLKERAAQ